MAVAFVDIGTAADASAHATPFDSTPVTVSGLSNGALLVWVCFQTHTPGTVTVTWDQGGTNQAMTQIIAANSNGAGNGRAELWGLINPTAGLKTLRVTYTGGATDIIVDAVSCSGVDQTGGATSFPNSTSNVGNSTTGSVTVTSAVNDGAVACGTFVTSINSVDQTQVFLDNNPANISGSGQRAAGAASVAFTQSIAAATEWVNVGTSIKATSVVVVEGAPGPAIFRPRLRGY